MRFPKTKPNHKKRIRGQEVQGEANNREFMRCDGMGKQTEEHWRSWQSWDLSQLACLLDPFPIQMRTGEEGRLRGSRNPEEPCGQGPQAPQHHPLQSPGPRCSVPGPGLLQANGKLHVAPLSLPLPGTDGEASRHS